MKNTSPRAVKHGEIFFFCKHCVKVKYGLPLVDVFARTVLVAGEMKEIVGDAAHTEIANLDGGVENAYLDADAGGIEGIAV